MTGPRLKHHQKLDRGIEQRALPRIDIRRSDGHLCRVRSADRILFTGAPYDMSLNSISFLVDGDRTEEFAGHPKVDFELEIPDYGSYGFKGSLIVARALPSGKSKIVYTLEGHPNASARADEEGVEFVFPPNYGVNAYIYKPSFFFERTFVRLIRVNAETISFAVYDLETLLFSGMRVDLFLFDSALQFEPLQIKVRSAFKVEKHLEVTADVLVFPKPVAKRLSQLLIFDFQMTIEAVKKLRLPVPKISDGLKFRFIRSEADYEEVLRLRLKAYFAAGKLKDGKTHRDMAAPLDPISRILVAYHGDKIVASIAISFPYSEDMILDTERAFPGGYPRKIPSKTESVEIARLCTDPEYRGSDLLLRIFEHTYRTLQCGGRKFIITSTDDKFWPLYKRLGFKKTGMRYPHPYLSGLDHDVIVVPVERAQTASAIDPLRWNYLYRDMNDFLLNRGLFRLGPFAKARVGLFRAIGKILRIKTKRSL